MWILPEPLYARMLHHKSIPAPTTRMVTAHTIQPRSAGLNRHGTSSLHRSAIITISFPQIYSHTIPSPNGSVLLKVSPVARVPTQHRPSDKLPLDASTTTSAVCICKRGRRIRLPFSLMRFIPSDLRRRNDSRYKSRHPPIVLSMMIAWMRHLYHPRSLYPTRPVVSTYRVRRYKSMKHWPVAMRIEPFQRRR